MKTYRTALVDVPVAVLPLDEICFPVDERISTEDSLWWIVWHGKKPVAYAGLRPCKDPKNKGLAFLCRAGVLPDHRGRGLQKRLIRARERAARKLGVTRLITYCMPYNSPSINSLVSCGYRFYWPAEKWGGSTAVYLHKKIK